jgi:hypothetical protein
MNNKALIPLVLLMALLACNLPALTQPPTATVSVTLTTSPAPSVTSTATPTVTATPPTPFLGTLQLDTLYEGPQTYTCDAGGCWRQDAGTTHAPEYYFTGIDQDSMQIRSLLQSVSQPSSRTDDDAEIWARTQRIWTWLNEHAVDMDANNNAADANTKQAVDTLYANSYGMKPPHFPTLQDYADSLLDFGVMARLSCTDRALNFAMLLYRAGVPVDRVAVVIANFAPTRDAGQHLFVVEYLGGEWYYIDPTCTQVHPALSATPERVGCTTADYAHPYGITVLPGSSLTEAMLTDPRP